jgi:hypothetical protein
MQNPETEFKQPTTGIVAELSEALARSGFAISEKCDRTGIEQILISK